MKPTDEQIKEFWELCGKYTYWTYEKGWHNFPPIDLNNLFKYAVPKVDMDKLYEILSEWAYTVAYLKKEDPALALFWAIYEVVK